jgi:hypothetical protein
LQSKKNAGAKKSGEKNQEKIVFQVFFFLFSHSFFDFSASYHFSQLFCSTAMQLHRAKKLGKMKQSRKKRNHKKPEKIDFFFF